MSAPVAAEPAGGATGSRPPDASRRRELKKMARGKDAPQGKPDGAPQSAPREVVQSNAGLAVQLNTLASFVAETAAEELPVLFEASIDIITVSSVAELIRRVPEKRDAIIAAARPLLSEDAIRGYSVVETPPVSKKEEPVETPMEDVDVSVPLPAPAAAPIVDVLDMEADVISLTPDKQAPQEPVDPPSPSTALAPQNDFITLIVSHYKEWRQVRHEARAQERVALDTKALNRRVATLREELARLSEKDPLYARVKKSLTLLEKQLEAEKQAAAEENRGPKKRRRRRREEADDEVLGVRHEIRIYPSARMIVIEDELKTLNSKITKGLEKVAPSGYLSKGTIRTLHALSRQFAKRAEMKETYRGDEARLIQAAIMDQETRQVGRAHQEAYSVTTEVVAPRLIHSPLLRGTSRQHSRHPGRRQRKVTRALARALDTNTLFKHLADGHLTASEFYAWKRRISFQMKTRQAPRSAHSQEDDLVLLAKGTLSPAEYSRRWES